MGMSHKPILNANDYISFLILKRQYEITRSCGTGSKVKSGGNQPLQPSFIDSNYGDDWAVSTHKCQGTEIVGAGGLGSPMLIVVRSPAEWDIVRIPGGCLVSRSPSIVQTFFQQYVKDASLVISCKSGHRSAAVAQELVLAGMSNARNRKSVYLPWCGRFDPSLPHYGASGDRKMAL